MIRIRRGDVVAVLVLVQLVLTNAGQPAAVGQQETGNPEAKAAEIAKTLAHQSKLVVIPRLDKKVSGKIEKDDSKYGFEHGKSAALLFELPESKATYSLKVTSICNCLGFSKSILIPSGIFLNADFVETAKLEEDDLKSRGSGVEALVTIEGQRLSDRYLLIYTRGDLIGQTAGKIELGGVLVGALRQSRAAHGKVELEATLPKPKK